MSSATSLYITGQQLGRDHRHFGRRGVAGGFDGAVRPRAPQPSDFSAAFLVVAMFTLVAAPIALLMPRNAGDDLTGRRSVPPAEPARRPAE